MPFPHNTQTYYEYFEEIAKNHVDLLHNPDRTEKEVSFSEIFISSDPYDKIDISSFLHDKRTALRYPALICVGHDWDATGNGSAVNAQINAMFIVLAKADKSLSVVADQRRAAYVKAEQIVDDILGYIKADFKANPTLGTLMIESIKSEKIGPLPDQVYGVKATFSYINRYRNFCFNQDKFLVLTPAAHTMPDLCDPKPNPEYCDLFIGRLSAQQRACLLITEINGGTSEAFDEEIIGVFNAGGA
jgi:hypothetical protein